MLQVVLLMHVMIQEKHFVRIITALNWGRTKINKSTFRSKVEGQTKSLWLGIEICSSLYYSRSSSNILSNDESLIGCVVFTREIIKKINTLTTSGLNECPKSDDSCTATFKPQHVIEPLQNLSKGTICGLFIQHQICHFNISSKPSCSRGLSNVLFLLRNAFIYCNYLPFTLTLKSVK